MNKITWSECVFIEPRLLDVERQIKEVKDTGGKGFCANSVWYGLTDYPNFREYVYQLVGWECCNTDKRIRTSEAFDVVYKHLYDLLPPCRNCLCA